LVKIWTKAQGLLSGSIFYVCYKKLASLGWADRTICI